MRISANMGESVGMCNAVHVRVQPITRIAVKIDKHSNVKMTNSAFCESIAFFKCNLLSFGTPTGWLNGQQQAEPVLAGVTPGTGCGSCSTNSRINKSCNDRLVNCTANLCNGWQIKDKQDHQRAHDEYRQPSPAFQPIHYSRQSERYAYGQCQPDGPGQVK